MLTTLFGVFSCSKETSYSFIVKNQTNYTLDEVAFDWCSGSKTIFVDSSGQTGVINLIYKSSGFNFFGSGSLCVTVKKYSNSLSNNENTRGTSFERAKLDKKNVNTILISFDNNSNSFVIKLE